MVAMPIAAVVTGDISVDDPLHRADHLVDIGELVADSEAHAHHPRSATLVTLACPRDPSPDLGAIEAEQVGDVRLCAKQPLRTLMPCSKPRIAATKP